MRDSSTPGDGNFAQNNRTLTETSFPMTENFRKVTTVSLINAKKTIASNSSNSNYQNIPKLEPSKCSSKKSGAISAYAANTHQGIIRSYNEDRVSVILNMIIFFFDSSGKKY